MHDSDANPSPASAGADPNDAAGGGVADERGIELPPGQLSPDALRGLIEEFITREGTDYGQSEWTLEEKVAQVLRQLDRGEARIVFDLELESASIVTPDSLGAH